MEAPARLCRPHGADLDGGAQSADRHARAAAARRLAALLAQGSESQLTQTHEHRAGQVQIIQTDVRIEHCNNPFT